MLRATASSATVGEAMAVLTDAEDSHTFAPPSPDPAVLPHHVFAAYRRTGGSRNDLPVAPWLRAIDGTGAEVSIVFRAAVRHVDDDGALMAHLRAIGPAAMREAWTVSLGSARSLLTPSWMQHLIVMDPATLELRRERDRNGLRPGDVLFLPPPVTNPLLGFGDLERDVSGTVVVSRDDWSDGWNVRECARAVMELVHGGTGTLLLPTTEADLVELLPDEALLATVRTELNDDPQRPWIQVRPVRTTDRESPCAVPLDVHGRDVGEVAGQWARRLGLPRAVCEDIALAGRWHDAGKSAPWQSRMLAFTLDPETGALVPGEEGAPALGKSALPRAMWRRAARLAGVPDGFRHEAASAALFDAAVTAGAAEPHDAAFVRHLILSHHGHFRGPGPVVPAPLREAAHLGVYQDPAHPAWHRALSDFRDLERRWGPYTLSLAETILRLADWYVSRKGGTA